MIIAYMMSNETNARDGIGFITIGFTERGTLGKLKTSFSHAYQEIDTEDNVSIEWNVGIPGERDHAIVKWKSKDDGAETSEFYWIHTAEA